jgi:hypothetical protein
VLGLHWRPMPHNCASGSASSCRTRSSPTS